MPDETANSDSATKNSEESSDSQAQRHETPFVLQSKPVPPAPENKRSLASREKEEASQSPFSVTVGQVYDGPLDLLLDLIRKQNIDIYDITIALITAQFLDYCHQLRETDVDAAGEFIYLASLLLPLK